jgi:hypothetical protein
MLRAQRLAQQRIAHQVDLAHRQVVRGPPVGVDTVQLLGAQRRAVSDLHQLSSG